MKKIGEREERLCKCIDPPPGTRFIKGEIYRWSYGIDSKCAYYRNGRSWGTGYLEFLWYFQIISGKAY